MSCPQSDIIGVLDRLEGLTRVQYCQHCFGVGQRCQCSAVPHQAPGLMAALWMPPTVSYAAMVSSTETMDMLPVPTMENLLATAGVSRGRKPWTPP